MTRRCALHNAAFKNDTARWCKGSNPNDTCDPVEVTDNPLPHHPRMLPATALMMLGSRASQPGWLEFLLIAKQEGFGLDQPGDDELSDARWQEVALSRVMALTLSFDRMMGMNDD